MYGNCPGKFQWKLPESTNGLFSDFFSLGIQFVFDIGPFERIDNNFRLIPGAFDQDLFIRDLRNNTDLAVKKKALARGVIFYEHNLCSLF